jgi:hypothetical protein
MRFLSRRAVVLSAVAMLVLSLSSCGSKNEGKIIGKWKVVDSSKAEFKQIGDSGMYMYFEFQGDGTFNMGIGANDPNLEKLLAMSGKPLKYPGKYKLAMGETVNFTDFKGPDGKGFDGKDKATTKVTINGDDMRMTDPDGTTMTLKKMTDAPQEPTKGPPPIVPGTTAPGKNGTAVGGTTKPDNTGTTKGGSALPPKGTTALPPKEKQ